MNKRLAGAFAALAMVCGVSAPALAEQAATIEARTAPGGVVVTWRLAEPTTRAAFLSTSVIRDLWTVTTPALTLKDGVIEGAQPFDSFAQPPQRPGFSVSTIISSRSFLAT